MSASARGAAGTTSRRTSRSSTGSATRRSCSGRWAGSRTSRSRFTIISILAGCLTSYYIAFESGGPIAVTWGWLIVGLFSTIIALAMAEIASSFPTAGGLYYWASKLGSPGWGWATGWFNLIGQIAVTAAIGYGLSTFATVLFDDLFSLEKHTNDWFGFNYNETVYALYARVPARGVPDQHLRRPDHVAPEHGLGVLAHGRRRGDRDRADRRPGPPPVARRYVFGGKVNATGYGAQRDRASTMRRSGSCSGSAC